MTGGSAADSDGAIRVHLNAGGGSLADPVVYSAPRKVAALRMADFDGDADLDVFVFDLSLRRNDGTSTLGPPETAALDLPRREALEAADLDGDGIADLAVAVGTGGDVSILLNEGDGINYRQTDYQVTTRSGTVLAADLEGDGDIDLVVQRRQCQRRYADRHRRRDPRPQLPLPGRCGAAGSGAAVAPVRAAAGPWVAARPRVRALRALPRAGRRGVEARRLRSRDGLSS